MTNEEIYEKVMGHKPNKEFGVKGSFDWNDIDALMNEAVKNCSIPDVVLNEAESEVEFYCDGQENNKDRCESQCLGCAGMQEIYSQ